MHLVIDIRSRHLEDGVIIRYAVNWAKKWKQHNPYDECTFLIFDQQEAPEWENFLRVRPSSFFSPSKKILSPKKDEIFRCINFSRYAPYDASIPTVTMIMDMGRWFYDNETNANILRRKEREYEIKKLIKNSTHFVVPSFFTGNELVELWNVDEKKVDILPFIAFDKISVNENFLTPGNFPQNFFLFDATFGRESNIEILLQEFSHFIHQKWGKTHLVLHGNSSKFLKNLTEMIRHQKLENWVHITGILDGASHEMLYKKAKAWIFVGAYNTTKVNIELAKNHNIPLILSDIRAFDFYTNAVKIHPNHLENLPEILIQLEKNPENLDFPNATNFDEKHIFGEFKKILMNNPYISKK